MTSVTATAGSGILYRSRRRIAIWALALALGGAAVGTTATLVATHDSSTSKSTVTHSGPDSPDSHNYKLGPGPH
jgi:hypothetical protein